MTLIKWRAKRYAERIIWAVALLGGKCNKCGSCDDLQFDHIDPKAKSFTITTRIRDWGIETLIPELVKCQLLCGSCHRLKTMADRGYSVAVGRHGTISTYTYCHCELCKAAKREWSREYYGSVPRVAPPHGDYRKYRAGCRCTACLAANAERMRKFRRDQKSRLSAGVG